MYVPDHFRESDPTTLFDFMEQHSFALLVSQLNGEPFASHLPLLVDRDSGTHGAIVGHLARANPHWQMTDRNVLVVFSGAHAYITPTWYEAANTVPTWNYTAVHAYGTFQVIEDHHEIVRIVHEYVRTFEASMPLPWKIAPEDEFVDKLAAAVVGFRIEITRLEGKFKLNQNHPRERREMVAAALERRGDENARAIAALIRRDLK
jgi:transcriptional regulator